VAEFFYDGQMRRYISQVIRVFSNFMVQYGDGTLVRIPVMYGDADRQVANIIKNNTENKINNVPRIAVYVSGLALDRDRVSDSSYVSKVQIRERNLNPNTNAYDNTQGRNYTVERLMPTPFKLSFKVDIWSSSTEQKMQIIEQILVLFNPSLEIQTNDNYLDWTSLTALHLEDINWSSKSIPVGTDTPIDVGTLTLLAPIWINPPVKVKHMGVITKIITNLYNSSTASGGYIEGLGNDPIQGTVTLSQLLDSTTVTQGSNSIEVYGSQVILLNPHESVYPNEPTTAPLPTRQGPPLSWLELFASAGGKYVAGSSMIYLTQPNGSYVVGTFAINPTDDSVITVNWIPDTLTTNSGIDSSGVLQGNVGYNAAGSYRPNSTGTFDAIINPLTFVPNSPTIGTRYLLVGNIGNVKNVTPAAAWGSLIATTNSIIEWTGSQWTVIFNPTQYTTTMVWQTNIYTGIQYLWNGVSWVKSYEGEYTADRWKIVL
jgi:hypothetical protein